MITEKVSKSEETDEFYEVHSSGKFSKGTWDSVSELSREPALVFSARIQKTQRAVESGGNCNHNLKRNLYPCQAVFSLNISFIAQIDSRI
jgi:hypothetical protein